MQITKIKKEETKVYGIRLTPSQVNFLLESTGAKTVSEAIKHLIEEIKKNILKNQSN